MGWFGFSFLFVFHYQSVRFYCGGIFTVLSNRIGGVALLIVIAWIINFGSRSFIYYLEFLSGSVEIELISFLVYFCGCYNWECSNPFLFLVACSYSCSCACFCFSTFSYFSYLLIRFSLSFTYWLNVVLLLVSCFTIFVAGLGANFEFDLKGIIALSTLRQLGLMIKTIHIGLFGLACFHP